MNICTDFSDLRRLERSLDAALDSVAFALMTQIFQHDKAKEPSRFVDVRSHLLRAIETVRAAIDDCNPILPMDLSACCDEIACVTL